MEAELFAPAQVQKVPFGTGASLRLHLGSFSSWTDHVLQIRKQYASPMRKKRMILIDPIGTLCFLQIWTLCQGQVRLVRDCQIRDRTADTKLYREQMQVLA